MTLITVSFLLFPDKFQIKKDFCNLSGA